MFSKACPRFVEFVESGITSGDEVLSVAKDYLEELRNQKIDTVVLGCTHFPLLSAAIGFILGPEVAIVSSADETARDLYQVLVTKTT